MSARLPVDHRTLGQVGQVLLDLGQLAVEHQPGADLLAGSSNQPSDSLRHSLLTWPQAGVCRKLTAGCVALNATCSSAVMVRTVNATGTNLVARLPTASRTRRPSANRITPTPNGRVAMTASRLDLTETELREGLTACLAVPRWVDDVVAAGSVRLARRSCSRSPGPPPPRSARPRSTRRWPTTRGSGRRPPGEGRRRRSPGPSRRPAPPTTRRWPRPWLAGQPGVRGEVRPGLPDPGRRPQPGRDPGRAEPPARPWTPDAEIGNRRLRAARHRPAADPAALQPPRPPQRLRRERGRPMSGQRSRVTTHVLDAVSGRPAAGVAVTLEHQTATGWTSVTAGHDRRRRPDPRLRPGRPGGRASTG